MPERADSDEDLDLAIDVDFAPLDEVAVRRAAGALSCATALFVATGAGLAPIGGLGDARSGLRALMEDPAAAWGRFARRRSAFRSSRTPPALANLVGWADAMRHGAFALTTEVDGHLQRAHFESDRIWELEGAIEWLQCANNCGEPVFPGGLFDVRVDAASGRAEGPLPRCGGCGGLGRPNVCLGEDDDAFDRARADAQEARMDRWLGDVRGAPARSLVVLEVGLADREARARCERIAAAMGGTLVRVDERDAATPRGNVSIEGPALAVLDAIEIEWRRLPPTPPPADTRVSTRVTAFQPR